MRAGVVLADVLLPTGCGVGDWHKGESATLSDLHWMEG